ncbi:MAG: glycosyltransferase [Flavobacteriales bacterium]|nr:glycosyltransferase [Flavobacteriales bacterium]
MNKKKICFIVSSPMTVKAFLLEHIKLLSTEYEVYLIANFAGQSQDNISPFLTEVFNVKIERNIRIGKDLKAVSHLKQIITQQRFDAIHTVTPKAGLLGMIAGKLAKTKVRTHIFTGQVWYTRKGFMKVLLIVADKLVVALSTNILVDSIAQRQFLMDHHILKKEKSKVLGDKGSISGVDFNKFIPDKVVRERYRKELNYDPQEIVFLFLGRLNIDKGVLDLAAAFSKLQNEFLNVKLLFIGFDEENLLPRIKEIVGDKNLKFYGPTDEPEKLMQAGDVLCLPSYREGFGTTIIEGSILRLPIICSDTYGLKETIIDNKTGLRHRVKDVESIYDQMKKLTTDSVLRTEMGEAGRQYVLNNFNSSHISEKWLAFYRELLKS